MKTMRLEIKKPIWGHQKVGIAEFRLRMAEEIIVDIMYKNRDGDRTYQHPFKIKSQVCFKYPVYTARGGVRLRLVPIADMEEVINGNQ